MDPVSEAPATFEFGRFWILPRRRESTLPFCARPISGPRARFFALLEQKSESAVHTPSHAFLRLPAPRTRRKRARRAASAGRRRELICVTDEAGIGWS